MRWWASWHLNIKILFEHRTFLAAARAELAETSAEVAKNLVALQRERAELSRSRRTVRRACVLAAVLYLYTPFAIILAYFFIDRKSARDSRVLRFW
jgi:hypothetical protein